VTLSELKELFELINEANITEFELDKEGVKLRIKKGGAEVPLVEPAAGMAGLAIAGPEPSASHPLPADGDGLDGLVIVPAPMVGTFYRQAEPGAEPFAGKGQHVQKGQTLCIIEAMKLMNEIESEFSGEIVEVFVDDGQSVQFGDKLFAIRES
jgi:acetyl-CoA carboxylase biotin carboxyl carrier protein